MKIKNSLLLLLTAIIWGSAFVAQSVGMDYIGPFTFNCVRSILGGLVLLPVIFARDGIEKKKTGMKPVTDKKILLAGGVSCGIILAAASSLQQFGLMTTSAGKGGFITAFYIVMVPVISLFFGKKSRLLIWFNVGIAMVGLYLLCITETFTIEKGDLLIFLCAVVFACHILVIDHFSPHVDGVKMSCVQFFTAGVLCGICMLLFEDPKISAIFAAWLPIIYAGVLSCGVAYTLQIVAQKGMNPTVASIILSFESVASVLTGWIVLGQRLSAREGVGCLLMFAAILLSQIPEKRKGTRREKEDSRIGFALEKQTGVRYNDAYKGE